MKKEKLVCNCRRITVGDMERVILNGAESFEKAQEVTGAARSCRRCREYAENVVAAILEEQKQMKEKEPRLF